MFDWQDQRDDVRAVADSGNVYIIKPVDETNPDGEWTCRAKYWDGGWTSAITLRNRRRAEDYAEELELSREV